MTLTLDRPLRVLFLTAEFDPYAKVGGLGDYSGSLPAAIRRMSVSEQRPVDIRVAVPYHGLFNTELPHYHKAADLKVNSSRSVASGSAFEFLHQGVPVYLVRRSGRSSGYNAIYNTAPLLDARKYIFYSLAVSDLVKQIDWQPDVIHANDWHTSLSLYRFNTLRQSDSYYRKTKLLQVIHNMPYLGEGTQIVLDQFDIQPVESDFIPEWAEYLPLPMGLVSADWISCVSPSYADELTTHEFGDGLAEYFEHNRQRTSGILNGIDTAVWNPENDPIIFCRYSSPEIESRLENKLAVLGELGLDRNPDKPLLIFISRLTPQKGVDILLESLPKMLDREWNAVFLGCGMDDLESGLRAFESAHPDRFRALIEFNNMTAHKLYAAGDILLMPSRYEPCGLSQMIAMRYGCVPVARAVGGLIDSIVPQDQPGCTGYLFDMANSESLISCLKTALKDFKDHNKWLEMQLRGMNKDFSWKRSAGQYIDLYYRLSGFA